MIFTKENLNELLRTNIVTVAFTKVNGEERVMRCTLLSEHIPNAPKTNGTTVARQSSSDVVSVWDLDANGWRSFKVNNVKSVSMGA